MNNQSKANLLLILTAVALLWHAVMLFTSLPVVTLTSGDGEDTATVSIEFDKVVVTENGRKVNSIKLPAKERYRTYFGAALCMVLYVLMIGFLLSYQKHWGQGDSTGVTVTGSRLGSVQNWLLFITIGAIVATIWSYLTIKGLFHGSLDFSMGWGLYVDFAHSLLLGTISILRMNPFEELPEPRHPVPVPQSQPQYLAPPPPPAPGSIACPACHMVQAQDSRFCKSCGRTLARPCSQCQTLVGPDARFCPKCGHSTAPTCPKCQQPVDPAGRFCKHCGAPTGGAADATTSAPPTPAKRKEIFVGAMQFVQDPEEEGFAFCSECGKKEEKRNLYYNDEIKQHVHRDCLMSLHETDNP